MDLIFEQSKPGISGVNLPKSDVASSTLDDKYRRQDAGPALPGISEHSVVRHFTRLSQMNFSVDANFYPLGSCTMKYNPKFTEKIAGLEEFAGIHPLLPNLRWATLTLRVSSR